MWLLGLMRAQEVPRFQIEALLAASVPDVSKQPGALRADHPSAANFAGRPSLAAQAGHPNNRHAALGERHSGSLHLSCSGFTAEDFQGLMRRLGRSAFSPVGGDGSLRGCQLKGRRLPLGVFILSGCHSISNQGRVNRSVISSTSLPNKRGLGPAALKGAFPVTALAPFACW